VLTKIASSLLVLFALLAQSPLASSAPVGDGPSELLGFHRATPTFSWKLADGKNQTAYRIEVTSDGRTVWDSRWKKSDRSTFVPYSGKPLKSRQRVTWRVNYRDEAGRESGWSQPSTFEIGLLSAADWKAKWIRPASSSDPDREPVGLLRRSFSITKKISRARLYATARGLFELQLNGKRVGHDHFANGFTVYNKRIDTLSYDVTHHLQSGKNEIEGLLGTGWYAGRFPFETKKAGPYGTDAALLAQLEIKYEDGSSETLVTDETWQGTFEGPIVSSSLYDGENYDARRTPSNWTPVIANADLGSAALTPKPFQPVRQVATLPTLKITQPQPGRHVFDLGQNMVGWARLEIPVEKDRTITLRFAEMLKDDGTLYTENYRSAKSTDTYTAAETGTIRWEPHFTFHGFRYVEISGLAASATPQKEWITGVVLQSDLPTTGTFTSSNEKLNQLQSNIAWGWRGNSLDIPTDCPQRDERAGWTGDAQVFLGTAMFNTDAHAFWRSWLGSMRDDQDPDGVIPDIIPTANQKFREHAPGWMDAATFIPWNLYVRTGDIGVLEENYVMMKKLVDWYSSQAVNGLLPNTKGHGDWLQPHPTAVATTKEPIADRRGDTPRPLLGSAFYAYSARIVADSARLVGKKAEAKHYDDVAATARDAFVNEYFDATGKLRNAPETQTAYALAIAFDLLPANLKANAGENLARLVKEAGNHLRTGFLGTPHLTRALDETGHADLAAEILFQETYPSWFYPINQGATTMWERWNSYTRDQGFGDASMNSFNHYAYGAIGQWLYERVAGIAPDPAQPGYKHFFVRPLYLKQLDHAEAKLETPYGKISSRWIRENGKVAVEIVVPANTTATIELPGREPQTVAAGEYYFDPVEAQR
jgi:alpha-L-rhamnosidase